MVNLQVCHEFPLFESYVQMCLVPGAEVLQKHIKHMKITQGHCKECIHIIPLEKLRVCGQMITDMMKLVMEGVKVQPFHAKV